MATTPLTDDQLQEIDDALLTGGKISAATAGAIALRYGVTADTTAEVRELVAARYNHPAIGPTGRRALDALNLWATLSLVE
jgi:hypothetical protein